MAAAPRPGYGEPVRVVELSDHPGDLLRAARQSRTAGQGPERRRLEATQARHEERVSAARRARDTARAQHRWGAWLRGVLAVRRARRQAPAAPLPGGGGPVPDREASLAAGVEGERLAAAGLGRALGDEWTLLRGYRNRRGEIDLVLVGPRGLFAIEVKYYNGTVSCDGDRWWVDRYDRSGRPTGREAMADARGRSPSTQLTDPARLLEQFLRSRGHQVPVQCIVLLTHASARLGRCTRPAVGLAASVPELLRLLRAEPADLPDAEVARLADRVRRDHEHYEPSRRPSARRR
jgi:Nuclease-related domain